MAQDVNQTGGEQGMQQELARALPKLSAAEIAQISPKFVREVYAPGKVIIRQGDPADRFYIVMRGRVEVWYESLSSQTYTVDFCEPGEYFGETGLLQNRPRSATVRATEEGEVEVLALWRKDFLELISSSRATETQVARDMIRRLINLSRFQARDN